METEQDRRAGAVGGAARGARPSRLLVTVAALVGGAAVLAAASVPGVFTIDEDNYLATVLSLREGGLGVPGTEGLPPSRELLYFDPAASSRAVTSTPVVSVAPPLYAFFAVPFSWLGWRGLVFLNALSFMLTALLVWIAAKRLAGERRAAAIAVAAFVGGSFTLEYAIGMWPHMLSVALCAAGLFAAGVGRERGSLSPFALSGLLLGLATGIRYQNLAFAAGAGFAILLLAPRRRIHASASYAAGVALPLGLSSIINHARVGSWNPISKGPGYLSLSPPIGAENRVVEGLRVLYTRLVDFSTHPPWRPPYLQEMALYQPDVDTGAVVLDGAVKKAWLQSSPWLLLALLALALAWRRRESADGAATRELRALALPLLAVLGLFALAGYKRTDGWCFNQRYLLELTPIAAVALGLFSWRWIRAGPLALGVGAGVVLAVAPLLIDSSSAGRHLLTLHVPILLAVLALAAVFFVNRVSWAAPALLGACLGWAFTLHVGEDLVVSSRTRAANRTRAAKVNELLPDAPSALLAWWGAKDAFGPLQLHRDLVIVDPWIDGAQETPALIDALSGAGRRVFVLANGFPRAALAPLLDGREVRVVSEEPLMLLEIGAVK